MNCSSSIDGLNYTETSGNLTKTSGVYSFTKSSTVVFGNDTIIVGTNRWDSTIQTESQYNKYEILYILIHLFNISYSLFHMPTSATKFMKCFFAIDTAQPFTSDSYTDLLAKNWIENSYVNPNSDSESGSENGRGSISIILLMTVLFGLLAF